VRWATSKGSRTRWRWTVLALAGATLVLAAAARLLGDRVDSGTAGGSGPQLLVSLNDIPDDMNDLLIAPPDGFQITIGLTGGEGGIDPASLVVTSSQDMGPHPAGTNLAPEFQVSPSRALWEVPVGFDLARTTHHLDVEVADRAGNPRSQRFSFAVRDFAMGPPLANTQSVFVDFGADRSLGPEVDFVEDLREFGLSSPGSPDLESIMVFLSVRRILEKLNQLYGRNPDGSEADDSANVIFSARAPEEPHHRICVGGESPEGPGYLGAASFDENNLVESIDECALAPRFGVFPHAIDDLWGNDPDYEATFGPLDPDLGGTPVGELPGDRALFSPGLDPTTASPQQNARRADIVAAFEAFTWVVATATAHEVGHTLGITAEGAPPDGHFGDAQNHNRTATGAAPHGNHIMNEGGTFAFAEVAAFPRAGVPSFRPFNWAYLRDRIAPDPHVTALYPAPALHAVVPNTVSLAGPLPTLTFRGHGFIAGGDPPVIELVREGDPTPDPVFAVDVIDGQTATGALNASFVSPGVYDVRFVNPDGQTVTLAAGLEVR
jgi:hypothetical protein